MRITACRIEAFGPFQARVFGDLDHSVVVVQGPNEAGKTSLFHFFREMLYGIDPPEAEQHPYARVGGTPALEGQVRYRLSDGPPRTVHRRLVSTPQARLTGAEDGPPVDLQNRPLPVVAHVSREVFASVYALEGRTLDELHGAAREEVQARLLHMMNAPHVRPAGEAMAALDEAADHLWGPSDDEGDTEAARLVEERRALREKLRDARTHDRQRRALHQSIDELTDRLEALKAERAELKAHLHRAERLRPVQALVVRMEGHAERAGDLTPFKELPHEPKPMLDRLVQEIERYEKEAARNEQARSEARATRQAFTDADRRVEDEADAIRAWVKKASAHERRVEHREALLRETEQITGVLDERAQRLFGTPWGEALGEALRALPEDELEARVDAYRTADDEVEALQVRADTLARKVDRRKRLWPWLAAAAAGLGLLLVGVFATRSLLWGPGAGLIVVGFVQAFNAWSYNRERTERLGEIDLEIEEQKEVRAEKSAALADLLDDLPLPGEEAAPPDSELWEALHELRRQAEERGALHRQAEALERTLAEAQKEVAALAERCGVRRPEGTTLPQTVAALEKRLGAAEARHEEAGEAESRLARLRHRKKEIGPALEKRRKRYESLKATLSELDDDPEAAIEELRARRRAARRAEHARETLFREHPDWEARREEIRALEERGEDGGEGWTYTDEEVVRMRERRDAVADEILEVEKQRTRKREEAEHLRCAPAPADVASKLAAVRRRLAAAGRRRDRMALLSNVLRRADRAFHLKHQPDVVKQAGRYLRTITGGRYHRLVLEGEERRLHVCRTPESDPQIVAPPLSQGLRDQVYLALRLALLDRLDESQEALPVFLDEVFTAWDRRRRQEAYAVIEELAERRQVFVFTCHPVLAEELSRRLDAHRLLLDAPAAQEQERPAKKAEAAVEV